MGRRFLDLVLSPEAVAVNRIIIGEVTRFPALGNVFWQAGPARNRAQIEGFLRRAADAGSLAIEDVGLATEQFSSLVRGEIHLRRLFDVENPDDPADLAGAARNAVATFLRAFGRV
jgi:TetR/AcrR family transcriptional repressor of mexJK operon